MVSAAEHPGYMGVMHAERASEDAYVVFRLDAPREITRLVYGGRMYNRAPRSRIELLHSFDGGATWTASSALEDTRQPWDVIHYETIDRIPPETRSVLVKYRLKSSEAGSNACSLFAVRMEADYRPAGPAFRAARGDFPLGRGAGRPIARGAEPHRDRCPGAAPLYDPGGRRGPSGDAVAGGLPEGRGRRGSGGHSRGAHRAGREVRAAVAELRKEPCPGKELYGLASIGRQLGGGRSGREEADRRRCGGALCGRPGGFVRPVLD